MESHPSALAASSRFALIEATAAANSFADDVRDGLTAARKSLPPCWFYDDVGSSLFDTICFLPEYYPTRSEAEILTTWRHEMIEAFGDSIRLAELGSGTARKTRILLDGLTKRQPVLEYLPVDIDPGVLQRSGRDLVSEYPHLRVTAIRADLNHAGAALAALPSRTDMRSVVLFLGSTIGNFDPANAVELLASLRAGLRNDDLLLLGVDLRKDRAILEPAYDDALGVTSAFNLNLLSRINRELGGRFPLGSFRHRAIYDEQLGRIEMHLVSLEKQSVRIEQLGLTVQFEAGETIHTENSYKHDAATLRDLAEAAGFRIDQVWTDQRGWFADALLRAC